MAGELVLITGGTGFVGYNTVLYALRAGYRIRLAVRNDASIKKIKSAPSCQPHLDKIEFVIVKDITIEGAYDEALKNVPYVIHIASAIPGSQAPQPYEETILKPAIQGTTGILKAALKVPSVQRIIITSSITAIAGGEKEVFSEDTVADAPDGPFEAPFSAYHTAKTRALVATRQFVEKEKPHFSIISILPAWVLGKSELNTDPKILLTSDISSYVPMAAIVGDGLPEPMAGLSVHSDDVAMIHVEALNPQIPGNQDFVLSSGGIDGNQWDDAKDIVRRHFPDAVEKGLLPLKGSVPTRPVKVDASKAERVFKFKYKNYEEQIVATVQHYLDAVAKSSL